VSHLSKDSGDPEVRASFTKTMSGNFDRRAAHRLRHASLK
jgi:hypothetical protein